MNTPSSYYTMAWVMCLMAIMYALGRAHQWFRRTLDRDEAYREGYDMATRSLFSTASRIAPDIHLATSLATPQHSAESRWETTTRIATAVSARA